MIILESFRTLLFFFFLLSSTSHPSGSRRDMEPDLCHSPSFTWVDTCHLGDNSLPRRLPPSRQFATQIEGPFSNPSPNSSVPS